MSARSWREKGPETPIVRMGWSSGLLLRRRALDVVRELSLRLRDLGLRVLQREIDVARQVERGGDARASRCLADDVMRLHALDLRERLLERVDDARLDVLGRRARPGDAHADRGLSTSGNWLTPMRVADDEPEEDRPAP